MGKQKHKRNKFHISSKNNKPNNEVKMEFDSFPKLNVQSNLFSEININFGDLKTKLDDDIVSVKSFKTIKSALGGNKMLMKKDRLKIRRQLLLRRIDAVNQLERNLKKRKGKHETDTIKKHDSEKLPEITPSLERFMKTEDMKATSNQQKLRSIDKAKVRKRKLLAGIEMMKNIQANEIFKNDAFAAVSEHIKSLVKNQN